MHICCLTKMSARITVRIPKHLKEEMERFSYVKWSEVVREAIEERVRLERIKWGLEAMERISREARLDKPSHQLIRELRDGLR